MVIGHGITEGFLTGGEIGSIVREAADSLYLAGKKVLVIIPDATRSMPMPLMFELLTENIGAAAESLDFLVAQGTHSEMTDEQLGRLIGHEVREGMAGRSRVMNHRWQDPSVFVNIGTIHSMEIARLSDGYLSTKVSVSLNKTVFAYDHLIICGPVFPHEVVGFSGGNKYFFPGIAGPEIINFTHWLGALITSSRIIGSPYTPVRAVIDRAASMIDRPKSCFSLVVTHEGIAGCFFGSPEEAWRAAAELSAQKHIVRLEKPCARIISIMPEMYDDLWTAAKGMYKMEPVVADGGEVVIFAPNITEVSYSHGKIIDEIGYHCRDYFLKQWDKFGGYPGGILAHSTHLKGLGSYDSATGIETPRIRVTLATGIPEERCKRINLGYLDPESIDFHELKSWKSEDTLVVPRAGEILYRLQEEGRTR